jgi:hypothetical protein
MFKRLFLLHSPFILQSRPILTIIHSIFFIFHQKGIYILKLNHVSSHTDGIDEFHSVIHHRHCSGSHLKKTPFSSLPRMSAIEQAFLDLPGTPTFNAWRIENFP